MAIMMSKKEQSGKQYTCSTIAQEHWPDT